MLPSNSLSLGQLPTMTPRITRRSIPTLVVGLMLLIIIVDYSFDASLTQIAKAPGRYYSDGFGGLFGETTDWTRFAYTQYVTDSDYLCNSVMMFESLHRLESQPDRVIMYPDHMLRNASAPAENVEKSYNARLLVKARDEYKVKLVPIKLQGRYDSEDPTWSESYTKLLAFNQTQYDRVLALDSDATVLKHMDHLFLEPLCPIAMPRAYWMKDAAHRVTLASHIMLLEPNATEFDRIQKHINHARENVFDMEIMNDLYHDTAVVLPHRSYAMLTGEFRSKNHWRYMGAENEDLWDPQTIFEESHYVHFSDWPVPKPWLGMSTRERIDNQPKCESMTDGDGEDCAARDIWNGLYRNFTMQRKMVCG